MRSKNPARLSQFFSIINTRSEGVWINSATQRSNLSAASLAPASPAYLQKMKLSNAAATLVLVVSSPPNAVTGQRRQINGTPARAVRARSNPNETGRTRRVQQHLSSDVEHLSSDVDVVTDDVGTSPIDAISSLPETETPSTNFDNDEAIIWPQHNNDSPTAPAPTPDPGKLCPDTSSKSGKATGSCAKKGKQCNGYSYYKVLTKKDFTVMESAQDDPMTVLNESTIDSTTLILPAESTANSTEDPSIKPATKGATT